MVSSKNNITGRNVRWNTDHEDHRNAWKLESASNLTNPGLGETAWNGQKTGVQKPRGDLRVHSNVLRQDVVKHRQTTWRRPKEVTAKAATQLVLWLKSRSMQCKRVSGTASDSVEDKKKLLCRQNPGEGSKEKGGRRPSTKETDRSSKKRKGCP